MTAQERAVLRNLKMMLIDDHRREFRSAVLRELAPEMILVIESILIDHDQSIGPEEQAEGVKQWWKLPATRHALDKLLEEAGELGLGEFRK